MPESKTSKLSG
jgi:hypothetical protein